MRRTLLQIRRDLKKSLSDLTQYREEYQAELEKIRCKEKDSVWTDSGKQVMAWADKSLRNTIYQTERLFVMLPKEKKTIVTEKKKEK